jgi:thymidylate synthase
MSPPTFSESTVDDLMHSAVAAVLSSGDLLRPSKGEIRDLTGVTLELTNPLARLSRSEGRGRLVSCLGELCWYLSGTNDTEFIAYYLSRRRDDDEDGLIHGGYGPRLFGGTHGGQVQYVIDLLRGSPDSRKAVVQIFDRNDVAEPHHDVPCTSTLQFLVRNDQLRMVVNMRSNDAYLGLPHDIFAFTMLQEMVARDLGLELGTYVHHAGSLHVYTADADRAQAFLDEGFQSTGPTMPAMPPGSPWTLVEQLLVAERSLRKQEDPASVVLPADPYWADLARVLAMLAMLKAGRGSEADAMIQSIETDAYALILRESAERFQQ